MAEVDRTTTERPTLLILTSDNGFALGEHGLLGKHTGYEDVFTKIEMCRQHYIKVGLGADFVNQFIR